MLGIFQIGFRYSLVAHYHNGSGNSGCIVNRFGLMQWISVSGVYQEYAAMHWD